MLHILVDGYNVIHASRGADYDWTHLSLEHQRNALLTFFASRRPRRPDHVTVVFDGSSGIRPRGKAPHGLEVVFSEAGVTADEVICKMIDDAPNPRALLVVSDDRQIKNAAIKAGAKPLSSRTFLADAHKEAEKRKKAIPPEPPEKYQGPKPGDVAQWRRVFGFDEEDEK
jgi:predicted RNA-binding protein with PIN domain